MDPISTLPTRKVRGDAKLERLTQVQHERLRVWLDNENRTYAEVVQLIRTEFSLSVGKTAVACYWQRHVLPHRYRQVAEDAVEAADLPEAKFSGASLKLVRMHAYIALASSEPDLSTAARLLETVRSADRLALAQERFAFAQRQAAATDKLAAERRAAEEARKKPSFDRDFANCPGPRISRTPPPSLPPPFPANPPLFPGLSAELRAKSPEISTPPPLTPPQSLQSP